jgi:hypothetical protein
MHAVSGPHGLESVPGPRTNRPSVGLRMAMCELRRGARCGDFVSSTPRKTAARAPLTSGENNGHEAQGHTSDNHNFCAARHQEANNQGREEL